MQKLGATGNTYDIQIEAKIIDDNQIRTSTTSNMSEAGEYKYYSVYTNIIVEKLMQEDVYPLKKDDYITVTVKNTNITIGTQLKNFIYKLTGKETYTIGATSSALVLGNGDNNLYLGEIEAMEEPEPEPEPTPTPTPTPEEPELEDYLEHYVKIKTKENGGKLAVAIIMDCEWQTMPYHVRELGNAEEFTRSIINTLSEERGLCLCFDL